MSSVDHPLNKNFSKNGKFKEFKLACNKTGTTEEVANAEKLGFDTNLFVNHPFIPKETSCLFCKFCFNGLRYRYFGCLRMTKEILILQKIQS